MSMIRVCTEDGTYVYSSTVDCADILEFSLKRNGNLILKITCPKDRVVSISIGKFNVPPQILKCGNKNFRIEVSKYVIESIPESSVDLKYGANNSFFISFKFQNRKIERRGTFRL